MCCGEGVFGVGGTTRHDTFVLGVVVVLHSHHTCVLVCVCVVLWGVDMIDESLNLDLGSSQIKATKAESQQIVAQRLLSCLQYLVT